MDKIKFKFPYKWNKVKILINGQNLIHLVRKHEKQMGISPNQYGWADVMDLYRGLSKQIASYILSDIGDNWYYGAVSIDIIETENSVVWSNLWSKGGKVLLSMNPEQKEILSFEFDKNQYNRELERLFYGCFPPYYEWLSLQGYVNSVNEWFNSHDEWCNSHDDLNSNEDFLDTNKKQHKWKTGNKYLQK
jgi:hypothetical protein